LDETFFVQGEKARRIHVKLVKLKIWSVFQEEILIVNEQVQYFDPVPTLNSIATVQFSTTVRWKGVTWCELVYIKIVCGTLAV